MAIRSSTRVTALIVFICMFSLIFGEQNETCIANSICVTPIEKLKHQILVAAPAPPPCTAPPGFLCMNRRAASIESFPVEVNIPISTAISSGNITRLSVYLDVSIEKASDIRVIVQRDPWWWVTLIGGSGDGSADIDVIFSDSAVDSISSETVLNCDGCELQPLFPLTPFNGMEVSGNYRFTVWNEGFNNNGTLNEICIEELCFVE